MSRILEALKKAVPRPQDAPNVESIKPLIFEKVSLTPPSSSALRNEIEAKKDSARLRYLLNERPHSWMSDETRRLMSVLGALLLICLAAAVLLWPHAPASPKKQAVENTQLNLQVAELETRVHDQQVEIELLQTKLAQTQASAAELSELESLRTESRRLNRRLAIMLQDNLEKDQEISRLSGR